MCDHCPWESDDLRLITDFCHCRIPQDPALCKLWHTTSFHAATLYDASPLRVYFCRKFHTSASFLYLKHIAHQCYSIFIACPHVRRFSTSAKSLCRVSQLHLYYLKRILHGHEFQRRIPYHRRAASRAHDLRTADDSRQLFPAGLQHGRLDHRRSVRRIRRAGGRRCLCCTDERLHLHRARRWCRRRRAREPRIRRTQL